MIKNKFCKRNLNLLFLLLCFFLVISSSKCADDSTNKLTLISKFKLDVSEPSALSLGADRNSLWTVSDSNSTVYLISLTGQIISSFILSDTQDLEGIEYLNDSTLAVVSEFSNELILCTSQGLITSRLRINSKQNDNHGLEGVVINKLNNSFYLVNEKNPALLIELTDKFIETKRTTITSMSDISDIYYNNEDQTVWLLSDEEHAIFRFNADGVLIEELPIDVTQPEGLAYDNQNKLVYIVSDKSEELFVYKLE